MAMKITIKREQRRTRLGLPSVSNLRNRGAKTTAFIIAVWAMLPAACDVKDPIYDAVDVQPGIVILTTDWSQRGAGIDIPGSYHVRLNGNEEGRRTFTETTNEYSEFSAKGIHHLHVYHDAAGISVDGNIATLDVEDSDVISRPGWFFSCAMDVEITGETEQNITAVMRQQVRELLFIIEPTGDNADNIANIWGTLMGVASTLDIDNDTHGEPSAIPVDFTKIVEGPDAGKWSATVRLLGIAGDEQLLMATIAIAGNGQTDYMDIDGDLTTVLAGFNTDKRTPLTLGSTVVATSTDTEFSGWNRINHGS